MDKSSLEDVPFLICDLGIHYFSWSRGYIQNSWLVLDYFSYSIIKIESLWEWLHWYEWPYYLFGVFMAIIYQPHLLETKGIKVESIGWENWLLVY